MIWLLTSLAFAQEEPEPAPEPTEAPAPAPAAGSEDLETAKKLYANGQRLYEEALYDEAIEAFQESYKLSGIHDLLFNIANAQERKGDLEGAVASLNKYRIYAPPEEQSKLDRRLRALENRLDAQKASNPAPSPNPVPNAPLTTTRNNPTKWAALGAGIGTTVVFGSLAAWSYTEGQSAIDTGDEAAYGTPRALNNASIGLTVVGLGLTAVGVALPSKREVTTVGLSITPNETRVRASWRF
jgi:tetratricopeptide (TPR) repeat protein